MKKNLKRLFLLVSGALVLLACGGNDLNSITFFSAVAGAFTINASDEDRLLPEEFVWITASATAENNQVLLDTFNLAQRDIDNILPESIDLTLLDDGANWRFVRTVQLYIYNFEGDDSLLLARLDTIPTNEDAVISLNTNNESLRLFLFDDSFQLKTLLELRDTVKTNYNFEMNGINRVTGGI